MNPSRLDPSPHFGSETLSVTSPFKRVLINAAPAPAHNCLDRSHQQQHGESTGVAETDNCVGTLNPAALLHDERVVYALGYRRRPDGTDRHHRQQSGRAQQYQTITLTALE